MTISDLALSYVITVPSNQPNSIEMPLVFVLHGRGADANDLADLAPLLDGPNGYRFVLPNAPQPFEAAPGFRFGYTWFHGVPAEHDSLVKSRNLLLQFVDQAIQRYPTPPGKVILTGFSQGGVMSLDVGFRTEQKLAGIVVMSGALHEKDFNATKKIPILIVHGTEDDMISVSAARRARRVLEQYGIEPEYHEFAMGHFVTPESMAVVADFVRRCLV